jgi:uncharacterized Rmd1/YagE family protein
MLCAILPFLYNTVNVLLSAYLSLFDAHSMSFLCALSCVTNVDKAAGAKGSNTGCMINEILNFRVLAGKLCARYTHTHTVSGRWTCACAHTNTYLLGHVQEVFFFDYGVVIAFGLEESQEQWIMQVSVSSV